MLSPMQEYLIAIMFVLVGAVSLAVFFLWLECAGWRQIKKHPARAQIRLFIWIAAISALALIFLGLALSMHIAIGEWCRLVISC